MSSSHFPAAAVCYCACVGGFTLPRGSGSRESRGGRAAWDCQDWLIKRPQERLRAWLSEGGKEKKEGGRTEGQGDGGEGSERRRTMRLLMRTFWGAYVGHCMNKQTFTSLHRWFTHSRTHRATLCCLCSQFGRLHTSFHISLLKRHKHTRTHIHTPKCIKTETHCLVFIVYAVPFHSFMDVAPSCPLFKLVGVLIHIKCGHVSLFYTHTHCLALWLTLLFTGGAV